MSKFSHCDKMIFDVSNFKGAHLKRSWFSFMLVVAWGQSPGWVLATGHTQTDWLYSDQEIMTFIVFFGLMLWHQMSHHEPWNLSFSTHWPLREYGGNEQVKFSDKFDMMFSTNLFHSEKFCYPVYIYIFICHIVSTRNLSCLISIGLAIRKIRQSYDCLIFTVQIPVLIMEVLSPPWEFWYW